MNWQKRLKGNVKLAEPLKRHTTYKIGGAAKIFFEPYDMQGLESALVFFKARKIPVLLIGAGSNILAGDKGIKAAVIRLNSPDFKKITLQDRYLHAGAGAALASLVNAAKAHGLSGLEFLSGIPGTVGGALFMNAGAWGDSIVDYVEKINLLDYNGKRVVLEGKNLNFTYRSSGLEKYIILNAIFKLKKSSRVEIARKLAKFREQKVSTQDLGKPSCGCVFKNPQGSSAGKLIDACGLKGRQSGGARISSKHANFILNQSHAKAADVLRLMALAKKEVKKKFKIDLQPEVKIWQ
ncbi:MAG: UDP-N-acetylmuramate dehydrogenase [Candidatus Omnitrophica bacterium]|nr:UDP-N-acetylmuramate dehydrogenase [Candidatus Omnitrophota bacterium]MDD5653058.1 UDP-N-acetylmuramate dehydrogenase [Candidatus Omnitrophota bacterium]